MANDAIRIIRDEHRSIEAVMHALTHLARAAQDPAVRPDFEVLRAMIRFIAEYPECLHHPKEDEQLFARLAARAPEAKPLLDELSAEDWSAIGTEFAADRDPLAGETDMEKLFDRIVRIAPAPIGLGEPWKKTG